MPVVNVPGTRVAAAVVATAAGVLAAGVGAALSVRRLLDASRSMEFERRELVESADNAVQEVTLARYALAVDDRDAALAALDRALAASRHTLSALVAGRAAPRPGDVVRRRAAR